MWRIVKVVLIALGTTVLGWCATNSVFFAKPITGRVVEAGTPTPLPGVTVVADWQLQGGMEGGRSMGHVAILETVTDADGRFAFPGWGPRFALPRGRLADRDPMLLLFKAGYFPKSLVNRHESTARVRTSDWDGATIPLEPSSRRPDGYASALQGFEDRIDVSFFHPGGCAWRRISHLLLALSREAEALSRKETLTERLSLEHWKTSYPECALDEDYVGRNGQWER